MLWLIFILCSHYLFSSPGEKGKQEALSSVSVRKQNNIWISEPPKFPSDIFKENVSGQSERAKTHKHVRSGGNNNRTSLCKKLPRRSDWHLFRAHLRVNVLIRVMTLKGKQLPSCFPQTEPLVVSDLMWRYSPWWWRIYDICGVSRRRCGSEQVDL